MKTEFKFWTTATTDISQAAASFIGCLQHGFDAQLVVMDNTDPALGTAAVMMLNPLLDEIRNWECSSEVYSGDALKPFKDGNHRYLNDLHRDLTEHFTVFYGSEEAADTYLATGEFSREMHFLAMDPVPAGKKMISYPIRKEYATKWRQKYHPESPFEYEKSSAVPMWSPRRGIPIRIPDPSIGRVYAVLFSREREPGVRCPSEAERIDNAIAVLNAYKESVIARSNSSNALHDNAIE